MGEGEEVEVGKGVVKEVRDELLAEGVVVGG